MINRMKALYFLDAWEKSDPRCKLLLMMLSISTGLPEAECLSRIRFLAKGRPA